MAKCRGCGASIVWLQTANQKMMPCDPLPVGYREREGARGKILTRDGHIVSCDITNEAEGIAAAKARGVHFGRTAKEKPPDVWAWVKMWQNGLVTSREAASALGVSHTTFIRWSKELS